MVALSLVAMIRAQELKLLVVFHAFCDRTDAEVMSQGHDRANDCGVARIGRDVANEAAIDLEVSLWRRHDDILSAMVFSSASPVSCPSVSFTILKLSRSTNATPTTPP
jgi:hypothetical protein